MLGKKILPIYLVIILTTNAFRLKCGKEGGNNYRISGGENTYPHQYPWMVYFEYKDPEDLHKGELSVCGGSLITDRLVLTAKHCVENTVEWKIVKAGVHDVEHGPFVELQFDKTLLPDIHDGDNDIAIITLKTPVDLRDPRIGVVCLPETDEENYFGEKAKTMGWGLVEFDDEKQEGVWEDELKQVDLNIAEDRSKFKLLTDLREINGVYQDPCAGDSGGPLLVQRGTRWFIIAVVSGLGYDCRDGTILGMEAWTKVAPNLKWIQRVIKRYQNQN